MYGYHHLTCNRYRDYTRKKIVSQHGLLSEFTIVFTSFLPVSVCYNEYNSNVRRRRLRRQCIERGIGMNITITIGEQTYDIASYTTVGELWQQVRDTAPTAVLARIDGELADFHTPLRHDARLEWVDASSYDAYLAYQRTLILLMATAVYEMYPQGRVRIEHSLGKAVYGTLETGHRVTPSDYHDIEEYMHQLVREGRPIERLADNTELALTICTNERRLELAAAISAMRTDHLLLYRCGNYYDYYLGPLLPAMSYLLNFEIVPYAPGFLLRLPEPHQGTELQPYEEIAQYSRIFFESTTWSRQLGCRYVDDLNRAIETEQIDDIIAISEAQHEKKLAEIADRIAAARSGVRLVTIAGPSSAGKTTTMRRLMIQMRVNGLRPVLVSLDDYYKERSDRPLLPNGEIDNESVDALDLTLLELQILALMSGQPVNSAHFDFKDNSRTFDEVPTVLEQDQPIILEGLHALNPKVSRVVPAHQRLNVFINALSPLTVSDHIRVSTTDTRLLRRMIRDERMRGHSPETTLGIWEAVRHGEEKYIFPYQHRADVIFNSALLYELPVLKTCAEPLLHRIDPSDPLYTTAHRLLKFLDLFVPLPSTVVPSNSILREFIGYGMCAVE